MNTGKPSFFQAYIICCTPSLNNSVYSMKKMMKMMKTMNNKEQFTIKENPRTCGFYADLCDVFFLGETECMIFHSKDKQVTSWSELYCKRGLPVTREALEECIREFIQQYDGGGND